MEYTSPQVLSLPFSRYWAVSYGMQAIRSSGAIELTSLANNKSLCSGLANEMLNSAAKNAPPHGGIISSVGRRLAIKSLRMVHVTTG